MRRVIPLLLFALFMAFTPPAQAQSDGDSPNKLSLEGLTGGISPDGGGYSRSRSRSYARHGATPRRSYRRRRTSYARISRGRSAYSRSSHATRRSSYRAHRHYAHRSTRRRY